MSGMAYWLVKTEPDVYSVDDLAKDGSTDWSGVRNYQARNFLTEMEVGDSVLVYHSNAEPSGVVGVGRVAKRATPDRTQFDGRSEYYDEKATREKPRWFCPEIRFVRKLRRLVSLDDLRQRRDLSGLILLQRGSRLSVIPVAEEHFKIIVSLGAE